jgi:hypothetical protein
MQNLFPLRWEKSFRDVPIIEGILNKNPFFGLMCLQSSSFELPLASRLFTQRDYSRKRDGVSFFILSSQLLPYRNKLYATSLSDCKQDRKRVCRDT